MGRYFGTDGFRGEANVNLNADHAYQTGRFLGWYTNRQRDKSGGSGAARVVIGKDTRRSGDLFEHALAAGLMASGADAYLMGVTTTPSVAFAVRTDGFDAGIMISASHNPYYDNGIKLFGSSGGKMDEHVIGLLEDYLDGRLARQGESLPLAQREKIGRTTDYASGRKRYTDYLISLRKHSFQGIRVGLDCANGSASRLAKAVFDALGVQTYVIYGEPEGCNINRDAGSTHMEDLQRLVVEKGLDAGFAYDGDADRCLCVDEKGNIVTGDHILYIHGKYMKARGCLRNNRVVTTVMSNFGLYRAFDALGIGYAKTAVGDKYVYEYMLKHDCCLGGEQSGHIIFSGYDTTGDGILTSLKVMEVMMAEKQKLSRLCEGLSLYPQVLKNIAVADKAAVLSDEDVQAAAAAAAARLGDSGRILVRESGTEPLIRVMVEAETHEICQKCVDEVSDTIIRKGYAT